MSQDFEGINIDIPAASPTSVSFYDPEAGRHEATTLDSVYEIADQMDSTA